MPSTYRPAIVLQLILAALLLNVFSSSLAIADDDDDDSAHTLHFATDSGLNFYSGDILTITNSSVDDLFAAGGIVNLYSVTAPSLFVAGGSVSLSDISVEDVIAAGGDVDISGVISDDLIAAGGRVNLRPGTEIGEDVIVSGGQLTLNSTIGGDLVANGGAVVIGSSISGNVTVNSPSITILSGTRINGDFTYSSRKELDLPDDVVVAGTLTRTEWRGQSFGFDDSFDGGRLFAIGITAWVVFIAALCVFAGTVTTVFPHSMTRIAGIIKANIFQNLGIGFAATIAIPAISAFLIATILGIPLGLFVLACYALMIASAFAVVCLWAGVEIRRRTKHTDTPLTARGRLGWTMIGVLAFALVGLVPFIGNIAQALMLMVAFGALLKTAWADRQEVT